MISFDFCVGCYLMIKMCVLVVKVLKDFIFT